MTVSKPLIIRATLDGILSNIKKTKREKERIEQKIETKKSRKDLEPGL